MSYSARFCAVAIFALMIAVKMSALFVDLLDDILAGRIGGAVEAVGGGGSLILMKPPDTWDSDLKP
jgi:hypothetical protein